MDHARLGHDQHRPFAPVTVFAGGGGGGSVAIVMMGDIGEEITEIELEPLPEEGPAEAPAEPVAEPAAG